MRQGTKVNGLGHRQKEAGQDPGAILPHPCIHSFIHSFTYPEFILSSPVLTVP